MSRLKWLCRRGMRELDQATSGYLTAHYSIADSNEQDAFRRLLELPDPDLLALLFNQSNSPDKDVERVLFKMRQRQ